MKENHCFCFSALFVTLLFILFSVVRPEGKGSRPHVFSLVPGTSMRTVPVLDVAANSQEELMEWATKIREVTATSEAKVNIYVYSYLAHVTMWVKGASNINLRRRIFG